MKTMVQSEFGKSRLRPAHRLLCICAWFTNYETVRSQWMPDGRTGAAVLYASTAFSIVKWKMLIQAAARADCYFIDSVIVSFFRMKGIYAHSVQACKRAHEPRHRHFFLPFALFLSFCYISVDSSLFRFALVLCIVCMRIDDSWSHCRVHSKQNYIYMQFRFGFCSARSFAIFTFAWRSRAHRPAFLLTIFIVASPYFVWSPIHSVGAPSAFLYFLCMRECLIRLFDVIRNCIDHMCLFSGDHIAKGPNETAPTEHRTQTESNRTQ